MVEVCGFEFKKILQCQEPKYLFGLGHLCANDLVNVEGIHKGVFRIKYTFNEILNT